METNPFITVTGTVSSFDADEHTFTMSPNQYIVLSRTSLPFPIYAHFANSSSTKRWGPHGPKVFVGSTITFGGLFEKVVCDRTHEKRLKYAQVEVHYIAYFGTQGNLSMTPPRMSSSYNTLPNINLQSLESENSSSGLRKRWNWESLRKSSDLPQASQSSSSASPTKRKHSEDDDDEREIKHQISDDSTTSQQSTQT